MRTISPDRYGDKLPEAIHARQIEAAEQRQIAETRGVHRIERIILASPDHDPNGNAALRAKIAELEMEIAGKGRPAAPKPPELLTYMTSARYHAQNEIPQDVETNAFMGTSIRDYVRRDDQRPPETVLDEVLHVCRAMRCLNLRAGRRIDARATA